MGITGRRLRLTGALVLGVLLAPLVLGVLLLTGTRTGHALFLRTALARAERLLEGELAVGALTTDGLLGGFTLHGVRLADPEGRPFVTADSVRVRYAVAELVRRNIVLVPVDIWSPRVVIESLHGMPDSNVGRIFPGGGSGAGSGEGTGGIALAVRNTRVHGGELVIRRPLAERPPEGRGFHERLEGPWEGDYRVLRFRGIDAEIGAADLLDPEASGEMFEVESLAVTAEIVGEPFTVTGLAGRIRREGPALELDLGRLRVGATEMSAAGSLEWGNPEGVSGRFVVDAPTLDLPDFRWLEPALPAAAGSVAGEISLEAGRLAFRAAALDLRSGGSRVTGELAAGFGGGPAVVEADLALDPLGLADLAPWVPLLAEAGGSVAGPVSVEGPAGALEVRADLAFEDRASGIAPFPAVVAGTLALAAAPSGEIAVSLEPLRYEALRTFFPGVEWAGEGRVRLEASGELEGDLAVAGEIEHAAGGLPPSRVRLSGTVRPAGGDPVLDLEMALDRLSLEGAALAAGGSSPFTGELTGEVRAAGSLSGLELSASLGTPGGGLEAAGRIDPSDPARAYRLAATAEEFRLDRVVPGLPEPTVLSGALLVDGSGLEPAALEGTGSLILARGEVGGVPVGRVTSRISAGAGRLRVEEIEASSPLFRISGSGELALAEGAPPGRVEVVFSADSLAALGPVVQGGEVIAADTLTALEAGILRLEGIDPDTLAVAEEVAFAGSAEGGLVLRGGLAGLRGEGFLEVAGGVFGGSAIARSRVEMSGGWRNRGSWEAEAAVELDSLRLRQGFEVTRASGEARIDAEGAGAFAFEAEAPGERSYAAGGGIARGDGGTGFELDVLRLASGSETWELAGPAGFRLEDAGGLSGTVELAGPGAGGPEGDAPQAVIAANGRLDRRGDSDLDLRLSGVDIERLGRLFQFEGPPRGVAALRGRLRGAAERPVITGELEIADFAYGAVALARLAGRFGYEDQVLAGEIDAESGDRRLLALSGRLPADLSIAGGVERRVPDRAIDLTAVVDSLPAAMVFGTLQGIDGVEGALSGRVRVGGTVGRPEPGGQLTLEAGAFGIPALGLRPREIRMDLRVREDRHVEVEGEARGGGLASVSGSMDLTELTDPGFDLRFGLEGFQAVDRRDLTASVGGELTLGGSFREPLVGGAASFDEGELFLEEFVQEAMAIDLSNPLLVDVVDTTAVAVSAAAGRPGSAFLDNLRVDVVLSLEQDFWIRSFDSTQGMDVELAGELGLSFDRPQRELRLAGSLEAVRGSYAQFGRIFDVESGTLDFIGTPGIDPSLAIQAVHRFRREVGEPLNVIANVGGTLQAPAVTLSSDAQPPIPESDLISYMLFGRPSYALASGEVSVVEGAAAGLSSALLNLGVSQLGTTFSRSLGVDYLSVSQAQQAGNLASLGRTAGLFSDTQIEMGRYMGENVFLAVTIRPVTGSTAARRVQLPSARLEWRFREDWSTESFIEDRLARQGRSSFGELDNDTRRVFGISVFRDWGY
ncbi:MAG: translocation/assembly module TamB [Gammaproteobacteria bacterium]|nr:translocation/assembly module TamB [Gammaproteobacteria bacterium]